MSEELSIELDEAIAEGAYANLAIIAHSSSEFVIDFVRLMPGTEKGRVKSRIILAPEQAKRLLLSLQENLRRYEYSFGDIAIHEAEHENAIHITPLGEA